MWLFMIQTLGELELLELSTHLSYKDTSKCQWLFGGLERQDDVQN